MRTIRRQRIHPSRLPQPLLLQPTTPMIMMLVITKFTLPMLPPRTMVGVVILLVPFRIIHWPCKTTCWNRHPVLHLAPPRSNGFVDAASRTNPTGPIIVVSVNDVSSRWTIIVRGSIIVSVLGITNIFCYSSFTPVSLVCIVYYSS